MPRTKVLAKHGGNRRGPEGREERTCSNPEEHFLLVCVEPGKMQLGPQSRLESVGLDPGV